MSRGLSILQELNGRWRGIMPSRCTDRYRRELLAQHRRTGEPSLAIELLDLYRGVQSEGWNKARGSYTEKMRKALWKWMEENYGSIHVPLQFQYKLHRHKVINVSGLLPFIKHDPDYGKGKKGFILMLSVQSIDGIPYRGIGRVTYFAWDRIIGRDKMLSLPQGDRSNVQD